MYIRKCCFDVIFFLEISWNIYISLCLKCLFSASTKNNNWPVNSAAHSCSSALNKREGWGSNHSSPW